MEIWKVLIAALIASALFLVPVGLLSMGGIAGLSIVLLWGLFSLCVVLGGFLVLALRS